MSLESWNDPHIRSSHNGIVQKHIQYRLKVSSPIERVSGARVSGIEDRVTGEQASGNERESSRIE